MSQYWSACDFMAATSSLHPLEQITKLEEMAGTPDCVKGMLAQMDKKNLESINTSLAATGKMDYQIEQLTKACFSEVFDKVTILEGTFRKLKESMILVTKLCMVQSYYEAGIYNRKQFAMDCFSAK